MWPEMVQQQKKKMTKIIFLMSKILIFFVLFCFNLSGHTRLQSVRKMSQNARKSTCRHINEPSAQLLIIHPD